MVAAANEHSASSLLTDKRVQHPHGTAGNEHRRKKSRSAIPSVGNCESRSFHDNSAHTRSHLDRSHCQYNHPNPGHLQGEDASPEHGDPAIDLQHRSIDSSDSSDDESPFFIARKLLRRRHIRKEQLKKEREAREAHHARDSGNRRRRKPKQGHNPVCESRCRGVLFENSCNYFALPQLSPIMSKTETISDLDQSCDAKGSIDGSLGGCLQTRLRSKGIDATTLLSITCAFPVSSTLMTPASGLSFSPVRSRAKRSAEQFVRVN